MLARIFSALIILFSLAACGGSTGNVFEYGNLEDGPVVVSVNGTEIHQGFLDVLGKLNPRAQSELANPLTRIKLINSIVDQALLYQEALDKGLDKNDDVKMRSLLTQQSIIANAFVEDALTKAMKEEYEKQKGEKFTKLNVSLIAANFFSDEKKDDKAKKDAKKDAKADKDRTPTALEKQAALDRIKKIKSQLDKGEAFDKIATAQSDDKMTAKKGGAAGEISKDDMRFARLGLKEVVDSAFKLKKDEVSEPIETKKGYYLVKVTSDPTVTPIAEAERVLRFELQSKIKDQLVGALRKNAKIKFAQAEKQDAKVQPEQQVAPTDTGVQKEPIVQGSNPVTAPTTPPMATPAPMKIQQIPAPQAQPQQPAAH